MVYLAFPQYLHQQSLEKKCSTQRIGLSNWVFIYIRTIYQFLTVINLEHEPVAYSP